MKLMKESDLYIPIRNWLQARGYEVHVEIFGCDIVAMKDGKLTAVEMKLVNSSTLLRQTIRATWFADFVYAAIASEPRYAGILRSHGIGLLQVSGTKIRERFKPRPQPWMWHKRRAYRMKKLSGRLPAQEHETAGIPCCPALREQRQQREINQ